MQRLGRGKARRSLEGHPRRPLRRARKVTDLGRRELRALSKTELISRVLELQARDVGVVSRSAEHGHKAETSSTEQTKGTEQGTPTRPAVTSLVIASSVRSGQTVEFPDGDVTVIGSVGSGAEIVAGGSIHVYGVLRGRAIAGSLGDQKARIFCQNLQAELLSIAGGYRLAENFDPQLRGRAIQAHLDGRGMALTPLDSDAGHEPVIQAGGLAGGVRRRAADGVRQLISMGGSRGFGHSAHPFSRSSAASRATS
jgi:septum site-determining protein MinC